MKKKTRSDFSKKDKSILYLILFVSLLLFILILINLNSKSFFISLDKKVNLFTEEIQTPVLINISKLITNIFDPIVFVIISLIIISYLLYKNKKTEAYLFLIILAFGNLIVNVIKLTVQRLRPENMKVLESTFSFPSSHALIALIFFGTLVYLFKHHIKSKKTKLFLIAVSSFFTLLIGITRILLNAHWLSDVLAGFILGIFLLVSYILIISRTDIFKTK